MKFPSKEIVEMLRREYPAGTRVKLVNMDDPYNRSLKPGDKGSVVFVDSIGTIHVSWDNGSSFGVAYGVDSVKKI